MAKKLGSVISNTKAEDDWATQHDLDTLVECEKIEKDPKRLKAAQALAKKRLMDLASVASEGSDD